MPLLLFGTMYLLPPFAVSWTLVRVINALVRGPQQRLTDHRAKQFRRRVEHCESVETCPHGMSVLACRFEGRPECADWLRAQILSQEFSDFTPQQGRRRGLTDNGEWLAIIVLTVVLAVLLLRAVLGG